jgi:RNA polymerase sigma factor (TIGR02999 family)
MSHPRSVDGFKDNEEEAASADSSGFVSVELIDRIYNKLKPLAARVQWRGADPALHPSSLVHEAYLKLMKSRGMASRPDNEVLGIFAHVMRQIMVDAARRNKTGKRGGGAVFSLSDDPDAGITPRREPVSPEDLLSLEAAMTDLRSKSPRQADIIDRRFYLGMTADEVAAALGISKTTVEREERSAKAFLRSRISPSAT